MFPNIWKLGGDNEIRIQNQANKLCFQATSKELSPQNRAVFVKICRSRALLVSLFRIPMKTRLEGNRLIIRDQPVGFWLFYSFFVAGGLMALVLSLSAAPDATTALIGSVIGLGNIAGGLYMIIREPASIVEIDKAAGEVRVCRWYPIGKRHKTYSLSALSGAEVEITEHSEGGSVYRPKLCFGAAEVVPASLFWYQTREPSEAILREIQVFLSIDLIQGSVA